MTAKNNRIYLDYAAATPVLPVAHKAMLAAEKLVGNPGALHAEAVKGAKLLAQVREGVAQVVGCKAREIIFTSGGTESNNLAILGFARHLELKGKGVRGTHWVVSSIEHSSVIEPFGEIERLGGMVTFVEPDARGVITPEAVALALRPQTIFVSVGWANGEIGTIQPLSDIVQRVRAYEKEHGTTVLVHSDAGQAPLYLPTLVNTLGVDLLTLDSGKLYGPRGAGALFLSKRVELAPLVLGGSQESGLRAGTENVALIVGFAAALQQAAKDRKAQAAKQEKLRNELFKKLQKEDDSIEHNGSLDHSLPNILNISVPGIQCEYVVLAYDRLGVALSTKSACREGKEPKSHVIKAIIKNDADMWRASTSLRFSLGRGTTAADIVHVAKIFSKALSR